MNRQRRVPSFLTWAFVLSLIVHALTLPFFGLQAQAHGKAEEIDQRTITIERHPKPTPPPPSPTPPPPVLTPPPIHRAAAQSLHRVAVATVKRVPEPRSTRASGPHVSPSGPGDDANGPAASTPPGPILTSVPGTAEPTLAPATETPKPACAKPHADAAIKGQAVEPEFPESARNAGETGTTEVRVTLAANGTVVDAAVQQSSGFSTLDQEALKAARASSYSAEIVNCAPAAGQYLFTADFEAQ